MSAACEPVMQMCLLQYDTDQSRVHTPNMRVRFTYTVQGCESTISGFEEFNLLDVVFPIRSICVTIFTERK